MEIDISEQVTQHQRRKGLRKVSHVLKSGREQGPGLNTNNGSIVEEASQPPPRLKTYKKPVQGKVKKMSILRVVGLLKGGPGSGRKPSGVTKEHHDALTKAGFKFNGGGPDMVEYAHPSGMHAFAYKGTGKGTLSIHDQNGKQHGPDDTKSVDEINSAIKSAKKVPAKYDTRD